MNEPVPPPHNKKNWTPWRKANYDYFKKKLENEPPSSKLVDLGAGPLQFEDIFLKFEYTGVDFVKYPHVSLVTDLTKDIPLPDGSTDIVILSNTVEHIPNTEHLFSECYRLLARGGQILGTVPFLMSTHQEPYDFNRYTKYQLVKFLEDTGFTDIEVTPLGSLIDAYDMIELKTLVRLREIRTDMLTEILTKWRRLEMRMLRHWFKYIPAEEKTAQGYAFNARKSE